VRLRPYQEAAVDTVLEAFEDNTSVLIVLPTGTGKTVVFGHVIHRLPGHERALVLAHREELIWQAVDKIHRITGQHPDVEMADNHADARLLNRARVIVSSIQTQNARRGDAYRMEKFDPRQFGLVVIDEAHHATADTYRRVIDYYRKGNPEVRVLGVTATPDRHDEEALGQVFDVCAYDYEIIDAIQDGWLTPVRQRIVHVEDLDFSAVRTTAGDLNGKDLAAVMEYESVLHGIATPTLDLIGDRKTLVFAASVAHAERLCEIFNRHHDGIADWVCGKTPKQDRRALFRDYAQGKFQILVNVGVATEGFDEPGIQCIIMARPTKSRALYAQMAGRGLRPLPGLVDPHETAEARQQVIADSAKPACEIIDFVGNAGRHKLMTTADILGGKVSEAVVEAARQRAQEAGEKGQDVDTAALIEEEAKREAERQREAARRKHIKGQASYKVQPVEAFDIFDLKPERERGWNTGRQPTPKQRALLERQGVDTEGLTFQQAQQLISELIKRWKTRRCTLKQARILARFGYDPDVGFDEASQIIDRIAANGWKRPDPEPEPEPAVASKIDVDTIPL